MEYSSISFIHHQVERKISPFHPIYDDVTWCYFLSSCWSLDFPLLSAHFSLFNEMRCRIAVTQKQKQHSHTMWFSSLSSFPPLSASQSVS
jgi:hypothetical protein